jgi:hypothetical protein
VEEDDLYRKKWLEQPGRTKKQPAERLVLRVGWWSGNGKLNLWIFGKLGYSRTRPKDEVFVFLPAIDTEAQTSTSPLTIGIKPEYRTPGIIPETFTRPFTSSASRNEEIRAQETPPDRHRILPIAGSEVTETTSPQIINSPGCRP